MWKQYGDCDYIILLGAAEHSKNVLVPFLYLMTFGKELTVTQPRKLTGDGRGDKTQMHTQKRVHFRQTKNCNYWKMRLGIILALVPWKSRLNRPL